MANIDIFENFENYIESDKFRAFLYTPANQLVRELEMIKPVLNLRKVGFSTLDFELPAKIFDLTDLSLSQNNIIDYTLDGYEVEVWVGDLTDPNGYDIYRFIIKSKPSSMSGEKPTFSFNAVSSEWELSKLPIINWPGIERKAYKQTSAVYTAQPQSGEPANSAPLLTSTSSVGSDIALIKAPKEGTVTVTRAHTEYGVEIPLFPSSNGADILNDEYYLYQSGGTWYVRAYVPANIKVPVDNSGTVQWNTPPDQYKYYIYYQTDDAVVSEDITLTFEESPFFQTDGLTINEIVADLFANLQSTDSNMQHFLGWTFDSANSATIDAIRSGLSFNTTSVYDMLKSLEENYQVYIQYDTVQRTIKILPSSFGSNNGLRFEYGKYLKGINQDFNIDEQINYVQGKDANNVGFADVSWSGDNYLENYTYQLDGVTWDGSSAQDLPSRWLSTELATELAKRKYYQDQFRAEVWGDQNADPQKKGIVRIRYELQEQLVSKKLEIEEIDVDIARRDALIESYNNETDQQIKNNLDLTSLDTAYEIPDKKITENNLEVSTGISVLPNQKGSYTIDSVTRTFPARSIKTFTIKGSPDNVILVSDKIRYTPSQYYKLGGVINFKYQGNDVISKYFTIDQLGKELLLDSYYQVDSFVIFGSFQALQSLLTYEPLEINEIVLHSFETIGTGKSWTTFVTRQEYLKNELIIKKNQKQLEINSIEIGPQYIVNGFDETTAINESNIYGIQQLEERLDYIRTFTSIDYENLSSNAKTELKRIRRGEVYENTDIIDSMTLFKASEDYLLEKINPSITVSIDTISILQAYEAQSDWSKVQIGEKVDIYVPDIKVNIEAEIVEISIDFQNYSTSLVIATSKNYDRSFGKYFSDVYNLLYETVENTIVPNAGATEASNEFITENKEGLEEGVLRVPKGPQTIGRIPRGVSEGNTDGAAATDGPDEISTVEAFIDPLTETLVTTPPVFSIKNAQGQVTGTFLPYGAISPGTAKLTNGGLYIKDENDNLRVKLTSRDGLVAEQFSIDLDGNAKFAGTLEAASGTFSGTLAAGVLLGNSTLVSQLEALGDDIGALQTQIDNEISTWFYDGVPTLSNAPAQAWTTDDIKNAHLGDLYYDGETGTAYRFVYEDIDGDDPDAGVVYYWKTISDTAITAALAAASTAQATADGKMTYFTASTLTAVNGLNPQAGDVLIPSADIDDGGSPATTLYFKNTVYTYDGTNWLPEEKKAGTVGGWTITSDQIKSNNDEIILDNTNSTITVGSGDGVVTLNGAASGTSAVLNHSKFQLKADGSASFSGGLSAATGTFAGSLSAAGGSFGAVTIDSAGSLTLGNITINNSGIVGTDGTNQTFNLNATNGNLTITGGLASATSVQFTDTNLSINQSTYGYDTAGIFLGVVDDNGSLAERFSIKDADLDADANAYLRWTGSALEIKGDLNLSNTYFEYKLDKGDPATSAYIATNVSYDGDDPIGTDFGVDQYIPMSTGSSILNATLPNTWLDLGTEYTGFSQYEDGSHLDTGNEADNFTIGAVYFFGADGRYYEVIAGGSTYYIELSVGNSTVTPTVYQIPLDKDVNSAIYRMPLFQIAHEYTASSSRLLRFTLSHKWDSESAFISKDLKITVEEVNSVSNIFDTLLAATGTSSVVTSVNGLVGDIDLDIGGSVTSVGLALPDIFTITEGASTSPIETSGTLTATLTAQGPNEVFAGPSSGTTDATPTFRGLVAADLPDTYVSATATQTAKTFLAGPTSGSAAAPTFRTIATADIPDSFIKNDGDTMNGQLLMNAVTPTATAPATSDSQEILFRGRAASANVDRTLKMNSAGALLFGSSTVYHTGNLDLSNYVAVAGDTMTGDLTLERDGTTSVGSHGVIFQYNNGTNTLTKELNVTSAGTLQIGGTTVSLAGHTHSDYVAVAGDTMTGDLTLQYDGDTTANRGSHGVVFQGWNTASGGASFNRELNIDSTGVLKFNGTTISLEGHTHSEYLNQDTTRTANTVLAGPSSGSAAAPTFRNLVEADIPSLSISKITNLTGNLSSKVPHYTWSVLDITGLASPRNIARITDTSGLGSGGILYANGTSNSIVVNAKFEILVNHFQDIVVKSISGGYTQCNLRIQSGNDEDFNILFSRADLSTDLTPIEFVYIPFDAGDTVATYSNNPTPTYTTVTHNHTTVGFSENITATGGSTAKMHIEGTQVAVLGDFLGTTGGTLTGNLTISKADPVLILKDTSETNDTDHVSYLSFQDSANVEKGWLGFGSSGNTDFTITNGYAGDINLMGGNVGIGTATPNKKLEVTGEVAFYSGTGSSVYTRINSADQYHGLVLRGRVSGTTTQTVTAADEMDFLEYGGVFNLRQLSDSVNKILLKVTPTNAYFNGTGNFGIGETNPGSKLTVAGNISSTGTVTATNGKLAAVQDNGADQNRVNFVLSGTTLTITTS